MDYHAESSFLRDETMRMKLAAAMLGLAMLTACGGGPPPEEVQVDAYVTAIHNVPRYVSGAHDERSVQEAETRLEEFGGQMDEMVTKVKAQKVTAQQKAALKQRLDDELKKIDDSIKAYKPTGESPVLDYAQKERLNKAYQRFVEKVKGLSFD
jgi:hypothetical protein